MRRNTNAPPLPGLWGLAAALCGLSLFLAAASPLGAQHPGELTARDKTEIFVQHLVKVLQLDPARFRPLVLEYEVAAALADLSPEDRGLTQRDFIDAALKEVYPEYGAALESAARGEDPSSRLEALLAAPDPYLKAYADLQLAEWELRSGRYQDVRRRCEELLRSARARLVADHRACELAALAFAKLEKPLLEYAQYVLLLVDYQDVPPAVTARAKKRLEELAKVAGRPLATVAGWMDEVEKLLEKEVTAPEPTQEKEGEIVAALDKLIELQEAIERNTCSSCGGNCKGGCANGPPRGNRSSSPAEVSRIPPRGKGRVLLQGVSRARGESVWGLLKARDAARAIQSFRGRLPPRYEKLLEAYYRTLASEGSPP